MVTAIADNAFYGASWLKELDCSKATSLTTIGDMALGWCTSLRKITLPPNLATVGANAFDLCASLTDLELPADLATVGSNAFVRCYSLTNVVFNGNPPTINGGVTPNYSMFYGVNGFTLKVPPDWEAKDVQGFFSGVKTWQTIVDKGNGIWECVMNEQEVTPVIVKLVVAPELCSVTVTNPVADLTYNLEACDDLASGNWTQQGDGHLCTEDEQKVSHSLTLSCEPEGEKQFFRVTVSEE